LLEPESAFASRQWEVTIDPENIADRLGRIVRGALVAPKSMWPRTVNMLGTGASKFKHPDSGPARVQVYYTMGCGRGPKNPSVDPLSGSIAVDLAAPAELTSMQYLQETGRTIADWHYADRLDQEAQPCRTGNCVQLTYDSGDAEVHLADIETGRPIEVEDTAFAANALASILGGHASAFAYDVVSGLQNYDAARRMLQSGGHILTIPDGYNVGRVLGLIPPSEERG
jgi:hypothetical protein